MEQYKTQFVNNEVTSNLILDNVADAGVVNVSFTVNLEELDTLADSPMDNCNCLTNLINTIFDLTGTEEVVVLWQDNEQVENMLTPEQRKEKADRAKRLNEELDKIRAAAAE